MKVINLFLKLNAVLLLVTCFAYGQDQILDGNLSVGHDGGSVLGAGKSIYFGGVQSNTDVLSMFRFNREINSTDLRINFSDDVETGADRFVVGALSWVSQVYKPFFIVHSDGRVAIGTESLGSEKLAVNGKIRAQEIKVENSNWPDYVFEKSYQLPSLQETENHIKENGYLPGIPSAADVKENGIDLGEMNAKLLQKIEELTLHLIEQNKQLTDQRKNRQTDQARLNLLQKQVSLLEQRLAIKNKP